LKCKSTTIGVKYDLVGGEFWCHFYVIFSISVFVLFNFLTTDRHLLLTYIT